MNTKEVTRFSSICKNS